MNRVLERRPSSAHVAGWVAAGDDRARLRELAAERRREDRPDPPGVLRRNWTTATFQILGGEVHRLRRRNASGQRLVFFLHGGYFVVGPHPLEWLTAARLCATRDLDLAMVNYPRVPEFEVDAILRSTREAWALMERRYGAGNIAMLGASAGGGLALSLAMSLRDEGKPQPGCVALSSPWLDVGFSHPEAAEREATDLLVSIEGGRRDGELYAGSRSVTEPAVSPFFADPAGLCPLHIQAGTHEIFLPECRDFATAAEAAGVTVELVVDEAGQHCGALMPTPEGASLRSQLGDFMTRHTG